LLIANTRHHELIAALRDVVGAARLYRRQPPLPDASIDLQQAIEQMRNILQAPYDEPGLEEARQRVLYLCEEIAHDLKVCHLRGAAAKANRTRAASLCGALIDIANVLIPVLQIDAQTKRISSLELRRDRSISPTEQEPPLEGVGRKA
jgi:hypothetical protein